MAETLTLEDIAALNAFGAKNGKTLANTPTPAPAATGTLSQADIAALQRFGQASGKTLANAPAGVASSFVGKDFGSMGCADGVCAIASKAGLPVPKTASAREFESQLPQYGWVQTNDPNRAQIFTGPGSGNSGRHVGWIEGGKSYQADHVGSNGPDTTVQAYSIPGGAGYKYWTHASVASQPAAKVQPNVPMTPIIPPAEPGQIPVGMATAQVGNLLRDNKVPIDRNMAKYLKSYAYADNLISNLNSGIAAVTQVAKADSDRAAGLASLPPPDQSSLTDDIKRFSAVNPANAAPRRQMVNGVSMVTFYKANGQPMAPIFYGGGKPGDRDYGKRLASSDPVVASVLGASHPSDSAGDVISQQVQDYGSNMQSNAVKMRPNLGTILTFPAYLTGGLIKGVPDVVKGTAKFAQDAGLGQPMRPISAATAPAIESATQTNALGQKDEKAFREDVKGMTGLGDGGILTRVYNGGNPNIKNLQQIIKGEVAYTGDNPLIAVLNVLPFAEGVGKLSTVGARIAGRIGADGMARLGDSVLAQAAKTTDAATASALTAKGMQYHQIAAALKAGKNVGALQFAMGYKGPDLSTGKTIAETTGYKAPETTATTVGQPVDAAPATPYAPKIGANGKPTIKTLMTRAPDAPGGKVIGAIAPTYGVREGQTVPAKSAVLNTEHADAVQAAAEGRFEPANPKEYASQVESNKGGASPTQYTPEQLAGMNLYKLQGHDIYYGVKDIQQHDITGAPERDVVGVINNSKNAPGVATPAVMLHSIESGATTLDAWDVKGNLPSRYGEFGFKEIGRFPYDPSYDGGTPPQGLKKTWEAQGWKEGDPYPDVVYMKYGGIDGTQAPDRAAARSNYLRTGSIYGESTRDVGTGSSGVHASTGSKSGPFMAAYREINSRPPQAASEITSEPAPHHSNFQPRNDTGVFVEGKPAAKPTISVPMATGEVTPKAAATVHGMRMADLEDAAKKIGIELPDRSTFSETWDQVKARANANYIDIKDSLKLYNAERNPNLTNEETYVGHTALRQLTEKTIPGLLQKIESIDPKANPEAHARLQGRLSVAMADADTLSTTLYRSASSAGRRLAFQKAVVDGPLDSASILRKAQAAANGKLSGAAQTSIIRTVAKAKVIEKTLSERSQASADAALKRLESFDFSKIKTDSLKGCK